MAWNPSPEVVAARDAAAKLEAATGEKVIMCVVTYVTATAKLGYASYGMNGALCGEARQLADRLHAAAGKYFEE